MGHTSSDPPVLLACNEVGGSSVLIKRQASLEFDDFFFFPIKTHHTLLQILILSTAKLFLTI